MDDLDKIVLRRHDRVDVLVGARGLVDDAFVLAALDMRAVARAWSSNVKRRFASWRDMARPAPCEQVSNESALPLPRTIKDFAPIDPGIMPSSPAPARTAPLRVSHTSFPKWRSLVT